MVSFGSSGTETIVVVVQDQGGSFKSIVACSFSNSLNCTIKSLAHMYLVTRQKKLRTQGI